MYCCDRCGGEVSVPEHLTGGDDWSDDFVIMFDAHVRYRFELHERVCAG
ncbi:hypothetical protein TOK_0477 [Pseudonocardia sp. N23]|nr:hypothetical protein TOK_0477 [Pseudonocardia sp. N23]